MDGLTFDAETHVYRLDGEQVPSVTQILDDNAMLPDYSTLDPYYRQRGSAVHAALALELTGQLDWDTLDDHTRPYVERAVRFIEVFEVQPLVVEFQWADPLYRYAGTLDLFGNSNVGFVLFDWKAGQYEPAHSTQAAGGYAPLLELAAAEDGVPVTQASVRGARVAVVPLNQDLPKAIWVEDRQEEVATFRAALTMWHWRRNHGIRRAA